MPDALQNHHIESIAALIRERNERDVEVVGDHYLDVDGKVGKGVLEPLYEEGVHVIAVLPRENGVRLWFEEDTDV